MAGHATRGGAATVDGGRGHAVFGPVTGPALRAITCGGDFDRSSGHYLDNVVVTARPAGEG